MMDDVKIKISTGKTILAVISAIMILIVAQGLSVLIGNLLVMTGLPAAAGNLTAGILYPAFVFLGAKSLCFRVLKLSLEECKLSGFSLKPLWCIVAIVMPCFVSGVFLMTAGHWESSSMGVNEILEIMAGAVFFFGIGTGLVEEMVFRGVIMSVLEYRCNKYVAVLVPSVLFGLLHIIGNDLDLISIIQLIIAGSIVGIFFSLVAYESGNIWNGAVIHGIWNMVIIGGIVHIGDVRDELSIYNYVLHSDSFLITGGDFGIEASVISIAAYMIFITLACILIRKHK